MPATKVCTHCHRRYPATSEYWHRHRGALHPQCKQCRQAAHRAWLVANRDKVRTRDARRVAFKTQMVSFAEQARTGVCAVCKRKRRPDERQLDLHHIRYDPRHPLRWSVELCRRCHRRMHKLSTRDQTSMVSNLRRLLWSYEMKSGKVTRKGFTVR